MLENLGWTILRVWSTDWWYDPETAIDQLDDTLKRLLESRHREAVTAESATPGAEPNATPAQESPGNSPECDPISDDLTSVNPEQLPPSDGEEALASLRPPLFAKQTPAIDRRVYVRAALEDATANQGRFFDDGGSDRGK